MQGPLLKTWQTANFHLPKFCLEPCTREVITLPPRAFVAWAAMAACSFIPVKEETFLHTLCSPLVTTPEGPQSCFKDGIIYPEVRQQEYRISTNSIYSAICLVTSFRKYKRYLHSSGRDLTSILCALPWWPPPMYQNMAFPKVVGRDLRRKEKWWAPLQFVLPGVQINYLRHMKGIFIDQDEAWPPYFVHYTIYHNRRTEI